MAVAGKGLKKCLMAVSWVVLWMGIPVHSDELREGLDTIEREWSKIYYKPEERSKDSAYIELLAKTARLIERYPNVADAWFWHAVVKASDAENADPVAALLEIDEVRRLLNKALTLDPKALGGAPYVVLGTLYSRVPGWPVSFGDDTEAEKLFKAALQINADSLDGNYYYGQFLLENSRFDEAQKYLSKASAAPMRSEQLLADSQLHALAKSALMAAMQHLAADKKAGASQSGSLP